MKQHRIFVAINFPEKIKQKLYDLNRQWSDLPFRWIRKDDIHLTLVFIGATDEEYLLKTLGVLKNVGKGIGSFEIQLQEVITAPSARRPRYIWVKMNVPEELRKLHDKVFKTLQENNIRFKRDYYPYLPHTTLGRIKNGLGYREKGKGLVENSVLSEALKWTISVHSFEVMESFLSRSGARYTTLQSYKIGS